MESKQLATIGLHAKRLEARSRSIFYFLSSILLFTTTMHSASSQDLVSYQQLAIENNPALKANYKQFEAALTRVQQVNSLPDPTLSFGYFISPVETRVGPQKARFSLSQMFPWFGSLKAQGNVMALSAEASYQQFVEAQNNIRFEVAKNYYPILELDQLIKIKESNLDLLNSWKSLATSQYENGKTQLADVLRINLMIKEIETELSLLKAKKVPLSTVFNRILNRSDTSSILFEDSINEIEMPDFAETDWRNHPQILELNKRIESKEAQVIAIQKQSLPKIGAGLDYVMVSKRTDTNVPQNGQNAFMPMVSISLPIFRKKYTSAKKEVALQIEGYKQSIISVENELTVKYENLKYEMEREAELLELYQNQIEETQQIQRLMLSAFSNSGKDLDELLRIQMQLLNYEMKQVKAQTRLKILAENLDYLLARNSN